MFRRILGALLAVFMALSASSCVLEFDNAKSMVSGAMGEYKETVEMDNMHEKGEPIELHLDMKLADAVIEGTDDKLAEASFLYNAEALKPEFKAKDNGISIKNRPGKYNLRKAVNRWDVKVTEILPLNITMRADASEARLNVGSMQVVSANIDSNASKLILDFTGKHQEGGEARIKADASAVRLRLPEGIGVQIIIDNYEISNVNINNKSILKQSEKEYISKNYGNTEKALKIYADLKVTTLTIE